jgi:hypothetical protein
MKFDETCLQFDAPLQAAIALQKNSRHVLQDSASHKTSDHAGTTAVPEVAAVNASLPEGETTS